jgi:hypothetical protein
VVKTNLRIASLALFILCILTQPAQAYVEVPFTLGRVINESTVIVLMRVEKVDKEKHLIVYRKIRDVKGQHPGDTIKHSIGTAGFHPREWQNIMAWAEVGQTALFFHNGGAGECCIDNYWYQIYPGDWWNMSHAEPYLLRSFAGKPEKLATYVDQMLKGQEVTVPCMVDGDKNAIQLRTAKVQRLKASLKIMEFDQKRDFAGWGAQDLVSIQGMPGFSQYGPLARVDPGASGIAAADFDGDGKQDFCLFGEGKVAVLQNGGSSFNEIAMPNLAEGARSAAWGDVDGDGKPDLLLACPSGPRLYLNEGGGKFKDITSTLPAQPYWNLTSATFINHSDAKRPDILLADGFTGLRLWKNNGAQAPPGPPTITMGNWKICGPFENAGNSGVDTAYPPEKELKFDATYRGKSDTKAAWKDYALPDAQLTSVKVWENDTLHQFMVVYVHRTVDASGPGEMSMSLGGGGPIKAWINGHQVLNDHTQRTPAPDQVQARVPLIKGKNDLLIKYCYVQSGRSAYFKPTMPEAPLAKYYEDVSDKAGLGEAGLASNVKANHLLVADVNGDGRQDVLVGGGTGILLLSTPTGFTQATNPGISYTTAGVTPAFGDFNGDGKVDLVIPQKTGVKLLAGQGNGTFIDVTAKSGDAAKIFGQCTSVACGTTAAKGKPDLVIGCLRGCNRYLRNKGDGTFADATEALGLDQRIFNTRGVCLLDLNRDGVLDVVFSNEGQESNLLLSNPQRAEAAAAR